MQFLLSSLPKQRNCSTAARSRSPSSIRSSSGRSLGERCYSRPGESAPMPAEKDDQHRLAALAALASAAVLVVLNIDIVISQFPRGLVVLAGLGLAFAAAWYGLTRTRGARVLGSGIAILAVAGNVGRLYRCPGTLPPA